MIENVSQLLKKAKDEKYAIAHINILNLEWARATIEAAKETNTPVILALSDAVASYFGSYAVMRNMVVSLIEALDVKVPIAIHLDHGTYDGCVKAINCGFTSVMFDGSKLPIDENIIKTKEIVNMAHEKGITVEAEVGAVGGEEDGIISNGEIADEEECKMLVDTNIDALAAGIGNIHGKYPVNWKGLNFDTLIKIKEKTNNIPLVLHGGSCIPDDMIKKAISYGICKINVNTELHLAFCKSLKKYFDDEKDEDQKGYDIRNITKDGIESIKEVVKNKFTLFGSIGKA